jgi:hypothetical protein
MCVLVQDLEVRAVASRAEVGAFGAAPLNVYEWHWCRWQLYGVAFVCLVLLWWRRHKCTLDLMQQQQDPILCRQTSLPNEFFFSRKELACELTAVRAYLKALQARAVTYEMYEEEIYRLVTEATHDKHKAATLFLQAATPK